MYQGGLNSKLRFFPENSEWIEDKKGRGHGHVQLGIKRGTILIKKIIVVYLFLLDHNP